jgi:hypothetical protein
MFPPACGTWIAVLRGVLIARCAWHRRYYGSGRLLGVGTWRGVRIQFTDGICPKCAARVRSDFKVSRRGGRVPAARHSWMPGIAVVALAVMVALLLIARPTHDLPAPANVALSPPTAPAIGEPAASPDLAASASPAPRDSRPALLTRVPSTSLRDAPGPGRALPRATIVYRVRPPRDSAQAP